jgi:RNA polymerase sigma-70 factor (ECF subfamily)
MGPDPSDAELARTSAGSGASASAAEKELYRRFARRIELYGLRHLGNAAAAADLVHEVLLKVLEAIRGGRLEDPTKLASFVLGTCRNVAFDTRRADQRQRRLERAGDPDATVAPPALDSADVVRLFGCLGQLPEREANVLHMSFFEDRAADEIAERLALTAGNVRVIRHRALIRLAGCVDPEVVS